MKIVKFSANSFDSLENLPFNWSKDYSKFKHGSKTISRKFGKELGDKFANDLHLKTSIFPNIDKIVISSAPYKFIPVASTVLTDYFISSFNKKWSENHDSIELLKVTRGHSYDAEYGLMSEEQRDAVINSDDFYIDSEFIKGKSLILIDDIRITGAHERRMEGLLEKVGFEGTVIFVYYADYTGEGSPTIEYDLNYAAVNNLLDIDYIIKNEEFVFNTRVVKYILKSNSEEFENFIKYQTKIFRDTLHTNLIGNNYHKQDSFKQNYLILKTYL